jgi:hypothetical protein
MPAARRQAPARRHHGRSGDVVPCVGEPRPDVVGNPHDVERDRVTKSNRRVWNDVLAILGDERQANRVVRKRLFGDRRDAREHLAHIERLEERGQQPVYRVEPSSPLNRLVLRHDPALYSNPCFLMRT